MRSAADHVRLLQGLNAPDVWWYISNEPLPPDNEREIMQRWHADVIRLGLAAGLKLVVGNLATAAMSNTKADIDGGRWDVLLGAVGGHADTGRVMLGVHTYAHALIPWHCAGRNPDDLDNPLAIVPARWPTPGEVYTSPEDNWLVYRENWFVERIQALTGKLVDVAVTEFGWDRMPHIVKDWPRVTASVDNLAGVEVRGLPTLTRYFEHVYGNPAPQTACQQLEWTDKVYPSNYRCFALLRGHKTKTGRPATTCPA